MGRADALSRPGPWLRSVSMAPEELAQLAEVAEILGVSRATASRAVDRPGFPAPVDTLGTGRVWRRSDVEAWSRDNPPRGRGWPPKRDQ